MLNSQQFGQQMAEANDHFEHREMQAKTNRLEHEALEPRTLENWGHEGKCVHCKPSIGFPDHPSITREA